MTRLGPACRAAIAVLLTTLPGSAWPVDYPNVVRGHTLSFPQDEGAHDAFRTEWWYVTGWMETEGGAPLGFQITFFRTRPGVDEGNPSRFAVRQLLFAHAAVSDPRRGALLRDEKAARAGFGLAEAKEGGLDVRIDDWALRKEGESYIASVRARDFALELSLTPTQPVLLHGDRGFSQKGPDAQLASYYYSVPQLKARGSIVSAGREQTVAGVAWMDHEWMSTIMDEGAQGWDWTGLNLDDGGALVILQMRDTRGGTRWAFATGREGEPGSTARIYAPEKIEWTPVRHWRSPRTGVRYPIAWKITVGERTIELRPLMDDQENDARGSTGTLYWEGAVRAFDERGRQIGRGYLELTGYGSKLRF